MIRDVGCRLIENNDKLNEVRRKEDNSNGLKGFNYNLLTSYTIYIVVITEIK